MNKEKEMGKTGSKQFLKISLLLGCELCILRILFLIFDDILPYFSEIVMGVVLVSIVIFLTYSLKLFLSKIDKKIALVEEGKTKRNKQIFWHLYLYVILCIVSLLMIIGANVSQNFRDYLRYHSTVHFLFLYPVLLFVPLFLYLSRKICVRWFGIGIIFIAVMMFCTHLTRTYDDSDLKEFQRTEIVVKEVETSKGEQS